jgi:glycosyltransferase involved in cell wall biosynthesis
METKEAEKLRILFRGWFEIPHSYSIVNCFQIVNLYKHYKDKIEFYVTEMPYYREQWNASRKLVYSEEYNEIIRNLRKWNGEDVDLVYSITYPYNIDPVVIGGRTIPKCVFYTSEFATLDPTFFAQNPKLSDDTSITKYVKENDNLYMTSPSLWSSFGMDKYGLPKEKNRIITHGVDGSIFKFDVSNRKAIRNFYKVKDDDILLINIGAMTGNKGMLYILQILHCLVNRLRKFHYKLLLKGTGDLYQSKEMLESYLEHLKSNNVMTTSEMNLLLEDHIIFTDKTLPYSKINDLFNAADLYISPYLAEGFNLTSLEALSAGLPVMISSTGSTKEYMLDIYNNGGSEHIFYIDSEVIDVGEGKKQNNIDFMKLLHLVTNNEQKIKELKTLRCNGNVETYKKMESYIRENYSWDKVADLLYDYFCWIIKAN